MSNHTPGPWTYVRDGDYWQIPEPCLGGKDNYEGNEDDYRLIAAAPELLEALIAVLNIDFGPFDAEEAWPKEMAQANEAIAKATGG